MNKGEVRAQNFLLKKGWDHQIKIGPLYRAYEKEEISLFSLCNSIAKLIQSVRDKYAEHSDEWFELDEIQGYFEWGDCEFFDEMEINTDDYDSWLSDLYDWGDLGKRLWVDSTSA